MIRICGKALPPRASLLLAFDFACLTFVVPLLFMIPVLVSPGPKVLGNVVLSLLRLMVAGLACQAVFYYNELYNLQLIRQPYAVLIGVLRAFASLFAMLSVACVVLPGLTPVLHRVLFFALFLGPLALIARKLVLPKRRERVLVIGAGDGAADLQETILSCPEWNMEVIEIAGCAEALGARLQAGPGPGPFDRVIVTDARSQSSRGLELMLAWKLAGLPIEEAQNFYERATGQVRVDGLTSSRCIFSSDFRNGMTKRRMKRGFDVLAAGGLLLVTLPVMLVVAGLVWVRRDGPVLFVQERVGLFGRPFRIYKFRSMTAKKPGDGAAWAGQEMHRITKFGATLRKYRLDELPQLGNVLRGEMSLVGPRPEQPGLCTMLEEKIPFFKQRHTVPPGLTGWAQVKYGYGSSIAESKRKLEFDLFYVKHLSLWLDCAVLIETVKVVVVGRGAM